MNQTPATLEPAPSGEDARWFAEEFYAHDASLKAFLRSSFPSVRDIDDLVQESYLRVLKARTVQPIRSAKAFLFTVARRLALDLVCRKEAAVTDSWGDLAGLPVLEEKPSIAERLCYDERVELLAAAFVHLPTRCREIMVLRKLQGVSNKDIAQRLGIREGTVENQVSRGIKLCRAYLKRRGVDGFARP